MRTKVYIYTLCTLAALLISCESDIIIPEAGPLPSGTFIFQIDSRDPFKVNVAASAQNATSFFWDFGDGFSGQGQTASHPYKTSGTYTVTLTLMSKAGIADVKQTVTVNGPEQPTAGFTMNVNDRTAPLTIQFTNTSTFGATYLWEFGDGNTSTSAAPTHTYATGGRYSIRLTATGTDGIKKDSERREIFLADPAFLAGATSKTWSFLDASNSYFVTNDAGQVIIRSTLLDCELNDSYTFNRNGTYTNANGGDARLRSLNFACGPVAVPAPQNWSLTRLNNLSFRLVLGTTYIGDPASGPSYTITALTNERLELRFQRTAAGDVKETVNMIFAPK